MTARHGFFSTLRLFRRPPPSAPYTRSFGASRCLKDHALEEDNETGYDYRRPCYAARRNCKVPAISSSLSILTTRLDRSPHSHSTPDALHPKCSHCNHILSIPPAIFRRSIRGGLGKRAHQPRIRGRSERHGPIARDGGPSRLLSQHRDAVPETVHLLQHQTPLADLRHHPGLQRLHGQRPERHPGRRGLHEAQTHAWGSVW